MIHEIHEVAHWIMLASLDATVPDTGELSSGSEY